MKLIVVNDAAFVDGGFSQVAIASAVECGRRGMQVEFVSPCGPVCPELTNAPNLTVTCLHQQDIKNDNNRLRAMVQGVANFSMGRALLKLFAAQERENTIVHFHSWSKSVSPWAIRLAVKSGLKVIVSVQEYFLACPNGGFYVFKDGEICHRTPLSIDCIRCNCDSRSYLHKLWRVGRVAIQKHLFHLPDIVEHFILVSPLLRRVLEPFLPDQALIHMLDNPIAVAACERTPVEENQPFLFVGRFSREKGVVRFAEAVRDLNLPAVFVGDGHLRREVEAIAPNATFTGWLDAAGVSHWHRKARMLVFPSTWYEGQPLVPIEAAANGVPSILSDCNSAVDYLPDGVRALHFHHNSSEDLRAKLLIAQSNTEVKRLSEDAYSWYWANPWTLDRHVNNLESIYRSVLAGHARVA